MRHELTRRVATLFALHGRQAYEGSRRESVTMLEHALQCALLAEQAQAPASLVLAALLHDIGHCTDGVVDDECTDDRHELRALPWLGRSLGAEVLDPIRLHVAAKRYLVALQPAYLQGLSPASVHSLGLQGGPMDSAACRAFEAEPHAQQAVALRRWDDAAKTPGLPTPGLDVYLRQLDALLDV